jgi:sugar phosphate isomerase/epimerase
MARAPVWGAIGEMDVDWRGQIAALVRDGYAGAISLENALDGAARGQDGSEHDLRPQSGRARGGRGVVAPAR